MLAAKFLFGYNNENSERNVYIPSDIYFDQMYKSRGAVNRNERYNTTIEGTISFNKAFGENFRMDAVVGMGRYLNKYTGMAVSYTDNNDIWLMTTLVQQLEHLRPPLIIERTKTFAICTRQLRPVRQVCDSRNSASRRH